MTEIKTAAEVSENAVLPDAYAVHSDPDAARTPEQKPLPRALAVPQPPKSDAQWAYERLVLYIQNFEEQLDQHHEVAMGFAGGDTFVLRIMGIGYFAPDIITFYGQDEEGGKTQLIQHVSQLNVMLRAVSRSADSEEPNRIGFRLAKALETGGN